MGEYRTFQAKAKTKQGLYLWKTMERLDKTTRRQSRKRRTVYTRTRKSSSEKQPDPPNGQSRFRAIQKQPNPTCMYSSRQAGTELGGTDEHSRPIRLPA